MNSPGLTFFWLTPYILDASSHLYKRVCPSVRPSVRRSVRRSVTPSQKRVPGASNSRYRPCFKAFRNVVAVWGSGMAIFFVFRNGLKMSFAERFWFWNPSFFAIPEWLKNNDSRTPNFSCFRNDVCSLSNTCLWFWNAKIWAIPERDIIKGSRMCWNLVFWNLSDLRHSGMAKKCHFQNVFSS